MSVPNKAQQRLIDTTEGIVLVDAGAGTGKTYTVAHRYLNILRRHQAKPGDILLITFTNNAAAEMRERIVRLAKEGAATLRPTEVHDAPISTFHALAKRLLCDAGLEVPRLLGLDTQLASNFGVVQNKVLEHELFAEFLRGFLRAHPEHRPLWRLLEAPQDLLDLLLRLAAKGVVPTRTGWYLDGGQVLLGDRAAFERALHAANAQTKNRQTPLAEAIKQAYRDHVFTADAPSKNDLVGEDGKIADTALVLQAFDADRGDLVAFVHDLYIGYLDHCLRRNLLGFSFILALAFVLLIEDDAVRDANRHRFVMIDEFQDTSEIQFQIALLLAGQANLCCVGDWKQSIYSFQYAAVENILAFEHRLAHYAGVLNGDRRRVPFATAPPDPVLRVELTENYRSTQEVLDLAEGALVAEGRSNEGLDRTAIMDRVVHLQAKARTGPSRLEVLRSDDEADGVLRHIHHIVGNMDYAIEDDGRRAPTYGDIAVLSRGRRFALTLQERARRVGVPAAFEGGMELYETDHAKIVLAWFRILADRHSDRGWAVVLELAGYTLDAAKHMLKEKDYPADHLAFLDGLRARSTPGARARHVLRRHGLDDGFASALIADLQGVSDAARRTHGDVIRLLEASMEAGLQAEVDDHLGHNVVTIQTIHAAKGLEYPIVILADVNAARFPARGGGFPPTIRFDETTGLRCARAYGEPDGHPFRCRDWTQSVTNAVLRGADYDEERRLLYVALTRAQHHVVVSCEARRPSRFVETLHVPDEATTIHDAPVVLEDVQDAHPFTIEVPDAVLPRRVAAGTLGGEVKGHHGRGVEYGRRVHEFAARAARGEAVSPSTKDERHVAEVLARLDGTLDCEVACAFPVEVDGKAYVIDGKIDLIHRRPDGVIEVYDWKTTDAGVGTDVYAAQVGAYMRVLEAVSPGATVVGKIVHSPDGTVVDVKRLDDAALAALLHPTPTPTPSV